MSEAVAISVFFGDADRRFALTPDLVRELERKAGAGIGAVSRRMFSGDFHHVEVLETVRLGLVGGGETPERAVELVALYAAPRPLSEVHPVATAVLEGLWWGKAGGGS